MGIIKPSCGEIFLDNKKIKYHNDQFKLNIGYVDQISKLLDDTLKNNITLLDEMNIEQNKRYKDLIEKCGLEKLDKDIQSRTDKKIGEDSKFISGGEKQRISIARTLFRDPESIIFDEPTSALDIENEEKIMNLINQFKKDKIIMVITHNMKFLSNFDDVYILKNGILKKLHSPTNEKTKIATIIECRMGSSRLPGKVLLPILNKPALLLLIERIKKIIPSTKIILATTTNKKDDEIVNFAKKNKINFFRGSEKNVFKRVVDAAKFYKVDVINSVCGDCMLLDPKLVSEALKVFLKLKKVNQVDILTYDRLPHGFDCTIVDAKKLIESYKYVKNDYEKDNPTFCLRKIKKYKKFHLIADKKIQNDDLSLALDFWEDYEIINIIYNNLYNKKKFWYQKNFEFSKKKSRIIEN